MARSSAVRFVQADVVAGSIRWGHGRNRAAAPITLGLSPSSDQSDIVEEFSSEATSDEGLPCVLECGTPVQLPEEAYMDREMEACL